MVAWKYLEDLVVREKKKVIGDSVPEGVPESITPMVWSLSEGSCKQGLILPWRASKN